MILLDEIRQIKESKKDLKKFGLTIGIVMMVVAAVLLLKRSEAWAFWALGGLLLVILAFVAPIVLKPLNKLWMSLSIVLGWFMTRVILVLFFYVALTPTSLIVRLFKKDLLDRKIDGSAESYWQEREKKSEDVRDYERQF